VSWSGRNCEVLRLAPLPAAGDPYGYGLSPNITSWGGSIYHDNATGVYHLFVTEETDGAGLSSWISHSQIIHAVSSTPLGPYTRKNVVSTPPTTNPQIIYDPTTRTFLLFHIRGAGSFQLTTSMSVDGPFVQTPFELSGCNNPTAAWHPNGTVRDARPPLFDSLHCACLRESRRPLCWYSHLRGSLPLRTPGIPRLTPSQPLRNPSHVQLYVMCHDSHFSLYAFHPGADGSPAWKAKPAAAITTLDVGHSRYVPGNCEDPFLHITSRGHFHVLAHCYTCYWYAWLLTVCTRRRARNVDRLLAH
jgi:hypothetical protein